MLARQGAAEGLWLRAERQTGGRGRHGRHWRSPTGNLYASTLVRLRPVEPAPATLALVAAVALHQVVQAYAGPEAIRIKWPNDLLARGDKLSGILLERIDDAVVIGFGVNLASCPDDLPATSLQRLAGVAPDPDTFLRDLVDSFASWLARWRGQGLAPIVAAWLDHAHPKGTPLSAAAAGAPAVDGLFDGLEADGALRLRLADGSTHVIHAGDVFLI